MPRVGRLRGHGGANPASFLLRRCLESLLQGNDPACLGGNELECGCCSPSSSNVVDSLAAFCLHSDAARQFFIAEGGLQVLDMAGQSVVESVVSNALQLIECLSVSAHTQSLMLSHGSQGKPQILLFVVRLAAEAKDNDAHVGQDREALQHGALCLLTSWVQYRGSPFCIWALQQQAPVTRHSKEGRIEEVCSEPLLLQLSMHALTHPTSLVLRKAAARLFASVTAATLLHPVQSLLDAPSAAPAQANASSSAEATALAGHSALPPPQQTFPLQQQPTDPHQPPQASLCSQPGQTLTNPLLSACIQAAAGLVRRVRSLLNILLASPSTPQFAAFAALGQPGLDAASFMAQQNTTTRHKALCHGLLHLVTELCNTSNYSIVGCPVLQHACLGPMTLELFCCAWGIELPRPRANSEDKPPGQTTASATKTEAAGATPSSGPGCHTVPLSFIQDHQSRELALDTLLALICNPASLVLLAGEHPRGHRVRTVNTEAHEQEEDNSLQVLLAVVEQLLQQHTAAHVRAALSILGHVQFSSLGDAGTATGKSGVPDRGAAAAQGNGAVQENGTNVGVKEGAAAAQKSESDAALRGARGTWMQLLCAIFDAAWASEASALQPLLTASASSNFAPLPSEPIALYPPDQSPSQPVGSTPRAAEPIVLYPPGQPSQPATSPVPPSKAEPIVLYPPGHPSHQPASIATPLLAEPTVLYPPQLTQRRSGSRSSCERRGTSVGQQQQQQQQLQGGGEFHCTTLSSGRFRGREARMTVGQAGLSDAKLTTDAEANNHAGNHFQSSNKESSTDQQKLKLSSGVVVDLGLGYRVIVQVLHAWKQLLDSEQGGVLAALDATDWPVRVNLAMSHTKQLVVSAASKLLPALNERLDAAEAQACMQPLAALQGASGASDSLQQPNAQPNVTVEWSPDATFAAAMDAMGLSAPGSNLLHSPASQEKAENLAVNGGFHAAPAAEDTLAVGKDMQDFLEAFLAADDDGEQKEAGLATPLGSSSSSSSSNLEASVAGVQALGGNDVPLRSHAQGVPVWVTDQAGRNAASTTNMDGASAAVEGGRPDADSTMFLPWGACVTERQQQPTAVTAAAERDLADALTLLPDLDELARKTIMQESGEAAIEAFPFQLDMAAMKL